MTLALSIRQPWASLITLGAKGFLKAKDYENRNWNTNVRGRILIHAAKGLTWREYLDGLTFAYKIDPCLVVALEVLTVSASSGYMLDDSCVQRLDLAHGLGDCPLPRGGIIGSVELFDTVFDYSRGDGSRPSDWFSISPWFRGPWGYALASPKLLPFVPVKGQLGFFDVPEVTP